MMKKILRRERDRPDLPRPLEEGSPAPDFSLPATTGTLSLRDFRGQPVVLVFYPADHSSVCSNQLALYNEALSMFQEYDAAIIGLSVDDPESHRAFSQALNLKFPLLSDDDPRGAAARAYNVYNERDRQCARALFVVDDQGVIRWSYVSPDGVNPGANGILTALDSLVSSE
jgi:peroxiredoxin